MGPPLLQEIQEGKRGNSYFPVSLTVIRRAASSLSFPPFLSGSVEQGSAHEIRPNISPQVSSLLSRCLSDLDLGTSLSMCQPSDEFMRQGLKIERRWALPWENEEPSPMSLDRDVGYARLID